MYNLTATGAYSVSRLEVFVNSFLHSAKEVSEIVSGALSFYNNIYRLHGPSLLGMQGQTHTRS